MSVPVPAFTLSRSWVNTRTVFTSKKRNVGSGPKTSPAHGLQNSDTNRQLI